MSSSASSSFVVPNDEKWDHIVENTLRKTSMGFAAGLLPSLLFTRTPAARLGAVLFATGVGLGIGYGEARYLYDHNVMFDQRHVISIQAWAPKAAAAAADATAKQ